MALIRESTIKRIGFRPGDIKIAHYDISFTAFELVEPANDPGCYLLNGAVISQATFPILFARYGTTFNTGGEGAGNFRLPNYTDGRLPIPKGLTTFTTFGSKGGAVTETLTTNQIPSHSHNVTDPGHNHGVPGGADVNAPHIPPYFLGTNTSGGDGGPTHSATTGISIQNAGGGQAHNNMPPYTVVGGILVYYG